MAQALLTGIHEATMDYVFFTDADLQLTYSSCKTSLSMCPSMRWWWAIARATRPLYATVNAWGWNKLNRMLFGLAHNRHRLPRLSSFAARPQRLRLKSQSAMISAETLIP